MFRFRSSSHPRAWRLGWIAALCAMALLAGPVWGVSQFKRGDAAPEIALRDIGGAELTLSGLRGRIVIVIFGELYHDRTRQGCDVVAGVLKDARFEKQDILPLLVITRQGGVDDLVASRKTWLPATILIDAERKAFGAYQVAAMPSMIVVDRDGKVVHAIAGLLPRTADTLTDALLLALGKLSPEQFQKSLDASPPSAASEQDLRADRLAQLARQLARRGMDELATEKYGEVLKLSPKDVGAHLELASLMLKRRRLSEAEEHFRAALAQDAESVDGILGLAFVQTLRGGSELGEAERTVRGVLIRSPNQARAHYLLGLILEQEKRTEDAAAAFKKSAQLLLETAREESTK